MAGTIQFIGRPRVELLTPAECVARKSGGQQLYEFVEPFTCIDPVAGVTTIPRGFITNWASVPGLALAYLDDESPVVAYPSGIHDYRYAEPGGLTREQIDAMFHRGMLACGARRAQAWIAHRAVRIGGGSHFKRS